MTIVPPAGWLAVMLGIAGCAQAPAGDDSGPAATQSATSVASPVPPGPAVSPAPSAGPGDAVAVVRSFLMLASSDSAAALRYWDGTDADARAALEGIAALGGRQAVVGEPTDGDAGMGQRYVTVPFTIDGRGGRAVLHRIAEGFESDDPRAHEWRVRTLTLPDAPAEPALPAAVQATYDCVPGGPVLDVRFDNRVDTATVTTGGRTIMLTGQRPASGLWYAGDGYELRGKGRQARWAMPDGSARECLAR